MSEQIDEQKLNALVAEILEAKARAKAKLEHALLSLEDEEYWGAIDDCESAIDSLYFLAKKEW